MRSVWVAARRVPQRVEIVVVDDASTDDTAAEADRLGCRVVRSARLGQTNGGFPIGVGLLRNAGIKATRADAIVSIDDDCVVPPDYLQQTIEALNQRPIVATGQRPLEWWDPGQQMLALAFGLALRGKTGGAAEPSVAFRREVCPDGQCFGSGYAEIFGLTRGREDLIARLPQVAVRTDYSGWRSTAGWIMIVTIGVLIGSGVWWISRR